MGTKTTSYRWPFFVVRRDKRLKKVISSINFFYIALYVVFCVLVPEIYCVMKKKMERAAKKFFLRFVSLLNKAEKISPEGLDSHSIRRVLVVKQHDQLGDMLLSVPAIRGIARRFPSASVDVVASSVNFSVLRNNPFIRKIWTLRRGRGRREGEGLLSLIKNLRKEHYDLAIVLNTVSFSVTSMVIAWLSGARFKIGPSGKPFGYDFTGNFYNIELPLPDESEVNLMHESEHNLYPLKEIGVREDLLTSVFVPSSMEEEAAGKLIEVISENNSPVVVIHPGAGKLKNRWPVKKFARVANKLSEEYGAKIVAVFGPMDTDIVNEFLAECRNCPVVLNSPSIGFLGALIKKSSLTICNDTGVLHIAGAVGADTIAIFGPTDPARWKPVNSSVIALKADDGSVEFISVDEVMNVARQVLNPLHGDKGNV